ncbi:MAG: hypothetical protein CMK89_19380 [Pseudomonadales bacterium]|nr:hypothetical protein [Pseudomonadales bacterium]RLU02550.1 MAG: hypothetical protein D9N11_08620 [Ketobacter sp.]
MTVSATLNPTDSNTPMSDQAYIAQLRKIAAKQPEQAKDLAWELFKELQKSDQQYRLPGVFAEGTAPESPHGDCEGINMNLYGAPWLRGMDMLVRLGQLLGGIGWTGKTFNAKTGTGYNRLTPSAKIAALLVMPHYKLRNINDELIGFDFYHSINNSPVAPNIPVRAITYDAPEFKNPLVLPKTRDEIVEIVPDVYLGRVLIRGTFGWKLSGYFGLRYPVGG